jgi:3-phenylpropionate/trans-cinnamate dioxygenase ferredoxin component
MPRGAAMTGGWRVVARVGDVGPNDVIAVAVDDVEMVLGRDGDRYFAAQRRCVHRGGDLAEGIVSRGHLICPQHAWRFSTATGCHAEASQYFLVTYPVRVVGDQIEVDPRPQPNEQAGQAESPGKEQA